MLLNRVLRPRLHFLLLLLLLNLFSVGAGAQDMVDQCISASSSGQRLRDAGDLIGAEQKFVLCASISCPQVIRRDCQEWVSELGPGIPTILIQLKGESSEKGRVLLDGRQIRVSSAPLRLNPGRHELVWEIDGRESATQYFTVEAGMARKTVELTPGAVIIKPEVPPPVQAEREPLIPTASWIVGGVGVAAIGAFSVLGILAKTEYDRLAGTCMTSCTDAEISQAKSLAIAADVALGVGVASIATAVVLPFVIPRETQAAFARSGLNVGMSASPAGGRLQISGSF